MQVSRLTLADVVNSPAEWRETFTPEANPYLMQELEESGEAPLYFMVTDEYAINGFWRRVLGMTLEGEFEPIGMNTELYESFDAAFDALPFPDEDAHWTEDLFVGITAWHKVTDVD